MQTNPAVEQSKIVRWSESPCNQSGRKGKVCGGKYLPKSQVLSSELNTERVREDASGSEDDEDDELRLSVDHTRSDVVYTCNFSRVCLPDGSRPSKALT